MPDLVLDSGILIGLADGDPTIRAFLAAAYETAAVAPAARIVPAVAVAETVRGSARDAIVNRFLKHALIPAANEDSARTAGTLLGRTGGNHTIDALVVSAARDHPGAIVVTTDGDDMPALAEAAGVRIHLLKH